MLFGSKAWYTKRFKTNSLQSFLARKKKKSQNVWKEGGQAHPSLEYISWISGFDMIRL